MSLTWKDRFQVKPGRWVYIPTPETLDQGQQIKALIAERFTSPWFYYHLREGGHVAAIQSHIDDQYFINVDIENFFGAINRSRVTRSLKKRFPYAKARQITVQSTVRVANEDRYEYHLPYGYPQSTILASICLYDSALGRYLQSLSDHHNVSIYVDDIIISSSDQAELAKISDTLVEKSEASRLPFGRKKAPKVANRITAFNIDLAFQTTKITDQRYHQLLHQALLSDNEQVIEGILSYVHSVNLSQYIKMRQELFN
ncbi:reverse transcriptase domain-containing protein [Halomonas sp. CUBES01]|uniref:reverse transcriptase domain-containing protein n=1 Tax=Halomonas sp. CUBES01 TaxID=2897340 RepID=UPI001E4B3AA9|nr:reverse transcriptase domain-containing protein [Halomonas sp. CUBES01]MEC4767951.1 reverse transcriptase domain-containing protein [Halomonas sp. CUBES01]